MFYGSTVEHRQGSMISDPYESRHVSQELVICLLEMPVYSVSSFSGGQDSYICFKALKRGGGGGGTGEVSLAI